MIEVDAAWHAAVAVELKCVFGYGVLGPRLTATTVIALARECQLAHHNEYDEQAAALISAQQQPPQPLPDYPDLYPEPNTATAERLAVRLEQEAAAAWRFAYATAAGATGSSAESLRRTAQAALTASAVRATRWRLISGAMNPTVPFPGI